MPCSSTAPAVRHSVRAHAVCRRGGPGRGLPRLPSPAGPARGGGVMAPAIVLEDVHKRYRIYRERYRSLKEIVVHRRFGDWEDHWALRGVSFEVEPGSTFGLVGPNGAGKSTTLKLIARILAPDRGRVTVRGRTAALIELGAGFQLEYTGRENVYLNASLL